MRSEKRVFKIYLSTLFLSVYGKGKLGSRIGRGPTAGGEDFPCGYRQKKETDQLDCLYTAKESLAPEEGGDPPLGGEAFPSAYRQRK